MTPDSELDTWRSDWQSTDAVPPELRRRVEREIRARRRAWWLPIAVTVLIGGGTLLWAVVSAQRTTLHVATASWVFIAITWITGFWISRRVGGRPRPDAATTTAFLEFTVRVGRRARAGLVAGAVLYALFLAFMLHLRYRTGPVTSVGEYLLSGRVLAAAIVTVLLAVAGWHRYRRLGKELERLLAMQRQYVDTPDVTADQPGTRKG